MDKKILLALFLLILGSFWVQTFSHTVWGSDAHAFWLAKASAFFIDGRVTHKNLFLYWPYDHPLLWSLTATWLYYFIGEANEYLFQIVPFIILACLALAFYKCLINGNFWMRLFWVAILFFTPFLWGNVVLAEYVGNADLLVGYYFLLAVIYIFKKQFIYTSLFFFFASLAKNDAVPAVLSFLVFFPIFRLLTGDKWKAFFGSWLCLLLLFAAHMLWKANFGLRSRYLESVEIIKTRPFFEYIWYTANAFREEARQLYHWGIGWWITGFAVFTNIKRIFKDRLFFLVSIILTAQLFSYFLIYYITPENPASQIATSIFRLLLQLYPAALFLAYKLSYNK